MFPTSVGQSVLRNCIANRITVSLFHVKRGNARVAAEETLPVSDVDLPNLDRNPFQREEQHCVLCKYGVEPDYKNVRLLSQFQSRHTGRIYGRHITGLCKRKQERVEEEILKAQSAGLMGFMTKEQKYVHDPKLFDPNHPFRPHKY